MIKSVLTMLLAVVAAVAASQAPGVPVSPRSFGIQSVAVDGLNYTGPVRLRRARYTRFSFHLQGMDAESSGQTSGQTRIWIIGPRAESLSPEPFDVPLHGDEADVTRVVPIPYLNAEYHVVVSVDDRHGNRESRSFSVHP